MKIVIVNPPARSEVYGTLSNLAAIEIPVWAGLIASYLERKGYDDVSILDAEVEEMNVEQTATRLRDLKPDLAVFTIYGQQPSASTQCLPAAERVAQIANVRTLALGTHPSALPARTMEEGPWNYVAYGEGPKTILGLLHCLEGMGQHKDVPGLWWRNGSEINGNRSPAVIQDLNAEMGDRGFGRFDFRRYRAHNWHAFGHDSRSPYASLQTSLGCSFRCSFCCINAPFGSSGIRFWSPENVLKACDYLANEGVKHIKIPDEMFLLNPAHYEPICDGLIERDYGFNIWAYARVDTIKSRLLDKLKRAGFNWLGLGIESASEHVRQGVEKGRFTDLDIIEKTMTIRDHGINVAANYIFGLPDDTMESMTRTLELACELNTEWANFYCAMGYPGSALYRTAKDKGWALPDDGNGPGWIGYSQHSYYTLPLPTEALRSETVLLFRDSAFSKYFSRPQYHALIRRKFGPLAVAEIEQMTAITMQRKAWVEGTANRHLAETV